MSEECGNCNQATKRVNIGGRAYCSACGEPSVLTSKATRTMNDVGVRVSAVSARPAHSLHERTAMAKGGVLDLRAGTAPKIVPTRRPVQRAAKPEVVKAEVDQPVIARALPQVPRSQSISRFSKSKPAHTPAPAVNKKEVPKTTAKLPAHAETHHHALSKLVTQHHEKHTLASPRTGLTRYAAVAAAVAIMSGYVWLQNYPKLELHSASSKAGFALTLPAFMPSSYSLSGPVEASNGAATLSFKSPSAPDPLKITQHVTTWDSSSLRDNFVAAKNPNFTSVEGQGLTIYLWGKNQAAWVNHGIWYGIEGASTLSREQLLKIAYSL